MGIEPTSLAWKAKVLPLNYTRNEQHLKWWWGLDSNQRTQRERIYSPSPLTTRPPLLTEPAIMLLFCLSVKQIKHKKATSKWHKFRCYRNDSIKMFGAGYRNRTDDLRITSALLYHLS